MYSGKQHEGRLPAIKVSDSADRITVQSGRRPNTTLNNELRVRREESFILGSLGCKDATLA